MEIIDWAGMQPFIAEHHHPTARLREAPLSALKAQADRYVQYCVVDRWILLVANPFVIDGRMWKWSTPVFVRVNGKSVENRQLERASMAMANKRRACANLS